MGRRPTRNKDVFEESQELLSWQTLDFEERKRWGLDNVHSFGLVRFCFDWAKKIKWIGQSVRIFVLTTCVLIMKERRSG